MVLANTFFLDATVQGSKGDGFRSASLSTKIPHLSVALKRGFQLVHGSVDDVHKSIRSNDVPLYNFHLLFASIKFKF
jgi:hypothetical protein